MTAASSATGKLGALVLVSVALAASLAACAPRAPQQAAGGPTQAGAAAALSAAPQRIALARALADPAG